MKPKYWQIECTRHLKTLFKTKVKTTHLSEKKLEELIAILISKYALSDEEILEQCLRPPFKKKVNYVDIQRSSSGLGKPLSIEFMAQSADISVTAWLTD